MQAALKLTNKELVGFVQLQVGSLDVQVPVRMATDQAGAPLASFETDGKAFAILIRGERGSRALEAAMAPAVQEAMVHLSRKFLN